MSEVKTADRMPFGRFVALAFGMLLALWVVGYLPTVRLAGEAGIPAMLVGGGISLVASLVGVVPLSLSRGREPAARIPAVMGSMALRIAVAVILALALALARVWPVEPLLVWVAIAHGGLLVADTRYAMAFMRAPAGAESETSKG